MTRRRRTSEGEAAVRGIAQLLPWWACVALAILCYLALHAYATRPLPPVDLNKLGSGLMFPALLRGLATAGQYVLPIGLLAAAALSYASRRRRSDLVERATGSDGAQAIQGMSWQAFETLIGEGFRRQGYEVTERVRGGADGGVDLVLRKAGETHFVQAKHWKALKVGVEVVRELYGVMAAEGAAGGIVVTSGRFTDAATAFADGRNIQLVDGSGLAVMLQASSGAAATRTARRKSAPAADPTETPACPACSARMVRRTARRGANAGRSFWGCSAYAAGCRGTRDA